MPDFADFLDAKFDLDERSLAADVRRDCFDAIAQRDRLRCLDIGSGTGAMPLRLLDGCTGVRSIDIVALDRDERLLARARRKLAAYLQQRGFDRLHGNEDRLEARDAHRRIGLHFRCCDVARFEPRAGERYDLVTAHAFMDLVPMRPLLARIADWLAPGGLFYATLNYDGQTTLFPSYADEAFEAALLRRYDQSMEERRVGDQPTGGAWSGRRLHARLSEAGFDVLAWGSSDWNLVPRRGQLRGSDEVVLAVLLGALKRENEAHCDARRLDAWHRDRCLQLGAGRLGAIVHQIDVLAVRLPTPPTIAGREASGLTAFT
ncbi:MAG: class I SAM-dependent methyltransferase [Burkholderiaceae bacterium]|nr:class I SAM-dependent methyltransferase [Burkholderiaceae bacterium]